ncbi:2-C-methyl-D-erythritol 4-phosphate cytidylyltransferase [Luteolibacter pohnpeiensis]|uniref:2-C-methyl-D-erythritol 4-phosphate cytidylyltransferase n=1 Tax=Luteolibacter pohnpeiensis TaxID=454153 RepID=A0A934VV07_9BACT|nr:2-C-methyl-D-erythritol 4-phosphate cytidylyltransferase [Luteolibacter pohnpeiensis]MBK1881303.1 2-C-methyl-D-erythritol 4-phosphate cytidylyltransferase [Luteolibacter pohnpeiensis]
MTHDSNPAKCCAIVVAAGSSRRMGFDKLAAPLAGVAVLRRTLEIFLAAESIAEVIVVCPEDRWDLLKTESSPKLVKRVDGGKDRQDSVAAGLAATDLPWVAVHDGARPLLPASEIDRCVAEAQKHRAVSLARRVTETLKKSDDSGFCTESVSRENLWFMETPQIFDTELLRQAYAEVARAGLTVTDEVSALEAIGVRVKFVESAHPNLKITTPADLALAEALLK